MSIQSEITRLQTNINDTKTAISSKRVTVPANATSDDLADLVYKIPVYNEDFFVVHINYDNTTDTGTSDYGSQEILAAMTGDLLPIGRTMVGRTLLGDSYSGVARKPIFIIDIGSPATFASGLFYVQDQSITSYQVFCYMWPDKILKIDNQCNVTLHGTI